ncbi:hypothetical protein PSJ75_25790 [Escherichia coli]|nr:hypothetical protein [Escherichia coli]
MQDTFLAGKIVKMENKTRWEDHSGFSATCPWRKVRSGVVQNAALGSGLFSGCPFNRCNRIQLNVVWLKHM